MRLKTKDIPNLLTVSRVLLIPIFFLSFYLGTEFKNIISGLIFLTASLTDFLDGYLARKFKAQSNFGKLFDPIADKMIIATALFMLAAMNTKVILLPAVIILCREFLISGIREYSVKYSRSIPVNNHGKAKTAIQMVSIFILIINISYATFIIGIILLYISAILSISSSYMYLKKLTIDAY